LINAIISSLCFLIGLGRKNGRNKTFAENVNKLDLKNNNLEKLLDI
jgi:hypothetical protein